MMSDDRCVGKRVKFVDAGDSMAGGTAEHMRSKSLLGREGVIEQVMDDSTADGGWGAIRWFVLFDGDENGQWCYSWRFNLVR
jgi:hypothetical protein